MDTQHGCNWGCKCRDGAAEAVGAVKIEVAAEAIDTLEAVEQLWI